MNVKKYQCMFSLQHKQNTDDIGYHGKVVCANMKKEVLPMLERIYPEYNVKIVVLEKFIKS